MNSSNMVVCGTRPSSIIKDYHNRDERQKVYEELQGVLGMSIPEIKLKIAG